MTKSKLTADQKIDHIRWAFGVLAQELRLSGQMKLSNVAQEAGNELPESSCLRLYEILKGDK